MEVYRFCGNVELARGGAGKWSKAHLLTSMRARLPGVSEEDLQSAYALAWSFWQEVCRLTFEHRADPTRADILATSGNIDGPFSVLAWSELPDGSDRPLSQKYDSSERYTSQEVPPQGMIDLVAVMCHEQGHALGLEHAAEGAPDLMAPIYQPGRRKPQAGDIRRIQALYGPPVTTPGNQPVPGGGGSAVVIEVYNADKIVIPGWRVTKVT